MPKALSTIDQLPHLHIKGREVFCSTQDLAVYVNKTHGYVCRAVKAAIKTQEKAVRLAETQGHRVPEEGLFKFEHTPYQGQNGETYDAYDLDRNATIAMILSFRGAKATIWKMSYIAAFNRMEQELLDRRSEDRTGLVTSTISLRCRSPCCRSCRTSRDF
ncbi:hypothetical protein NS365_05645 [Aureimonas ureilytica]|uniref:Rha family transcriptional regulator n=1 Tax=Aureimonas ureilytica TaxID=401562 RepID=A0A175RSY1_9HYPH|nr:Rha family transcriptional regulator [Aureimonas ureilytica]KTR06915.1 hypothetical protein NS365_05645 [Aureimonas ureilytica]